MNQLHHFSDGLYAKEVALKANSLASQHKHTYDHLSVLAKGRVRVLFEGGEVQEYVAPACINIVKDVNHTVLALEDSVWYCIHATSETDVDNIDNVLIKEGV
jgi:quercetin dioxygenase-like cupin family protein